MPTVTVVARQVYMPKPGKKYGAIVTPENERFNGLADQLRGVQKGATVALDYHDDIWGDSPVRVIQSIKTMAAPAPGPSSGGGSHADQRMIFITGVVGRAMGSGQFSSDDVKILTLAADAAYTALQAQGNGQGMPGPAPRPTPQPAPRAPVGAYSDREPPPPDPRDYR